MQNKIVQIGFLVLTLLFSGCNLFSRQNNPDPVRPKQVRTTPRVTKKEVQARLAKIEDKIRKNEWDVANREVNSLGGDMLNHYPMSGKGRSLYKMANFDGDYAKLKVSVKMHRKKDALGDLNKMKKNLREIT